jgi:hypothetical protein
LPTAERLSVTSLVIDPTAIADARRVTMTLNAILGTAEVHTTPLGTFRTTDGGESWSQLPSGSASTD